MKPGEYTISAWDNKQCSESSHMQLIRCEHCSNWFCLMNHWGKHLDDLQSMPQEKTREMS